MIDDIEYNGKKLDWTTSSWSDDGGLNYRFIVCVENWDDSEDKTFYVMQNIKDKNLNSDIYSQDGTNEFEYELKFSYKGMFICGKTMHAISRNGQFVCAAFHSKYGIRCYDSESGLKWENTKIKKIEKIRFNGFANNILEVWHKDHSVTFIDVVTGNELSDEEKKLIHQYSNYIRVSENQEYIIIANNHATANISTAVYSVYRVTDNGLVGRFFGDFDTSTDFAITNDGKHAIVSAYDKKGVSLVDVVSGDIVWNNKKASHIRGIVLFEDKKEVLGIGNYRDNVLLNLETGENIKNHYNRTGDFIKNPYGADLIRDEKHLGLGYKDKPRTIDEIVERIGSVCAIPNGFVTCSHTIGLKAMDYDRNCIWKNSDFNLGINIAYNEKYNVICCFNMIRDTRKIWLFNADNGELLDEVQAENCVEAFIDNNNKLLCSTGMLYEINADNIKKLDRRFDFSM